MIFKDKLRYRFFEILSIYFIGDRSFLLMFSKKVLNGFWLNFSSSVFFVRNTPPQKAKLFGISCLCLCCSLFDDRGHKSSLTFTGSDLIQP